MAGVERLTGGSVIDGDNIVRPRVGAASIRQMGYIPRPVSALEVALWGFAIFLLTSPFTFTLTGENPSVVVVRDYATMRDTASQVLLYVVRFGVLAVAMAAMAWRWRVAVRSASRLLPLLPFVLWAALSAIWSDDANVTLHSVASLIAVFLASYLIALRLPAVQLTRAVLMAGLFMAVLSLLFVFVLPAYGIHQRNDATQSVHAGAWRGVYLHKNFLGQVAAMFVTAAFYAGPEAVRAGWLRWVLIAVLVFLIVLSTSASALAIIPISIALVWATVAASRKTRLRTFLLAVPAVIVGYVAAGQMLHALHRDATFSGRDVVWKIALESARERLVAGYGFVSISYGEFSFRLMRSVGVLDPHSAYFDVVLGTGLIGLVLFLVMVAGGWRAARRLVVSGGAERGLGLALYALMIGWLISGVTESSDRPFTSMGGLGLFALAALLAMPTRREDRAPVRGPVSFRRARSAG